MTSALYSLRPLAQPRSGYTVMEPAGDTVHLASEAEAVFARKWARGHAYVSRYSKIGTKL